jgi:quercetin dioxygenase-like cupin family protein
MKILRAGEVNELSKVLPEAGTGLNVNWLEGPVNGAQLDVGLVTLKEGATPPHRHIGGQVIVVLSGEGFVETGEQRITIGPGDVVVCPPGELHTHGSQGDGPMAHLTVTTGGYDFPKE